MKAVVLAGGEGTRLRPLTCTQSKPMTHLVGKPIVEYTVELLKNYGIVDIAFTLQYMPEQLMYHFGGGESFGIYPQYFLEQHPLGTAGSIKNAASFLNETFLVASGDALTDLDIDKALHFHRSQNCLATIILKPMENPLEYGIVHTDDNSHISRFLEKPGWSEVFSDTVSTGMYLFEPEILDFIPEGKHFDCSKNLFPLLIDKKIPISGYVMDGYWCDVGSTDAYFSAAEDILKGKVEVKVPGVNINGLWVQEDVRISNSALIQAPGFIGKGSEILDAARIGMYSVIGSGCSIGVNANIKRSIIGDGVEIGSCVKASKSVIGSNVKVGSGSRLFENTVIGSGTTLEEGVTVSPKAKIWPKKWIEKNATINSNIVWGYGRKAEVFSIHGLVGDINCDLQPEILARAGRALVTVMSRGQIAVCHDGDTGSRLALDAFVSGCTMAGAEVYSGGEAQLAELFAYASDKRLDAAIYAKRLKEDYYNLVVMGRCGEALEKDSLRRLNQVFDKGDFRRVEISALNLSAAVDLHSHYQNSLKELTPIRENPTDLWIGVYPTGKKEDQFLLESFAAAGYPAKFCKDAREKNILFCLKSDGYGSFQIIADEIMIKKDRLLVLIYALAFELFVPASVKIPLGTPSAVEVLAQRFGVNLQIDENVYFDPKLYRAFNDTPYLCILLAEKLMRDHISLQEYVESLPMCFTEERSIDCEWKDIGRIIKTLCRELPGGVAKRGVVIQDENGKSWVYPNDTFPGIRIKTDGGSEEFAKELCDFYTNKVRKLLKQ